MAGSGVTLGYLKYVLGFDSLAFQEGLGDAGKRIKAAQRSLQKTADKFQSIGTVMSVGITAPFTALVASSIPAAKESAVALGQVQSALTSMGDAAGRTLPQLQDQAKALMHLSTFDDDDIMRKVTANLLTFGKVSGTVFDRAQQAAVNLSARLGQDLQSSAIQLGKALNDPIKGVTSLARVGVSFTAQQKEQIKAMVAAGDTAGAQGLILGELEKQYGGAAKALRDATPGIESQQAWADFQETVGAIALKVLPPLSKMLADVLNWFNQLSPAVQTFAVGAAAIAAAIGPISLGFGTLLSVLAPLIAKIAVLGGAAGLPAIAAILGPLAIAVAAVVVAWKNWDQIGPWIDGVVQRTGQAWIKLEGYFKSLNDWADRTDKRLGTPTRQEMFTSFSAGLKRAWDTANTYDLGRWAASVDAKIAQMAGSAVASMMQLYTGVKTWVGDKLNAVWESVSAKIDWVKEKFFKLYDAVVGHSYIPDMVDQIGFHMARLDGNMVAPAAAAAREVGAAFAKLGTEVAATNDNVARNVEDTVSSIGSAVQGFASAFKSGNLLDILTAGVNAGASIYGAFKGGGNFGGFRAAGGPVSSGKSYVVGERGPEMFTARRSGYIRPNNDNGGGNRGGSIAEIVPSKYFDVIVDGRSAAQASNIYSSGARASAKRATRRL